MKFLSVLILLPSALAFADMVGEVHPFTSPGGVTEQCIIADKIPGGEFSKKDAKAEQELCSYDLYRDDVAMCPKTWSTSPGTMIYSTELKDGTKLSQAQFEAS